MAKNELILNWRGHVANGQFSLLKMEWIHDKYCLKDLQSLSPKALSQPEEALKLRLKYSPVWWPNSKWHWMYACMYVCYYELNCVHSKSLSWIPDCQCVYIWDRAFMEAIRVKCGHKGGILTLWDWCPYKKERHQKEGALLLHAHKEKARWGHCEKGAVCKTGKESLPEIKFDGTLTMDF